MVPGADTLGSGAWASGVNARAYAASQTIAISDALGSRMSAGRSAAVPAFAARLAEATANKLTSAPAVPLAAVVAQISIGSKGLTGAASFGATATLTGTGVEAVKSSAGLMQRQGLAASGNRGLFESASLHALGGLAASAKATKIGAATLAERTSLAVSAKATGVGVATLPATAALAAPASTIRLHSAATLAARDAITPAAARGVYAAASLSTGRVGLTSLGALGPGVAAAPVALDLVFGIQFFPPIVDGLVPAWTRLGQWPLAGSINGVPATSNKTAVVERPLGVLGVLDQLGGSGAAKATPAAALALAGQTIAAGTMLKGVAPAALSARVAALSAAPVLSAVARSTLSLRDSVATASLLLKFVQGVLGLRQSITSAIHLAAPSAASFGATASFAAAGRIKLLGSAILAERASLSVLVVSAQRGAAGTLAALGTVSAAVHVARLAAAPALAAHAALAGAAASRAVSGAGMALLAPFGTALVYGFDARALVPGLTGLALWPLAGQVTGSPSATPDATMVKAIASGALHETASFGGAALRTVFVADTLAAALALASTTRMTEFAAAPAMAQKTSLAVVSGVTSRIADTLSIALGDTNRVTRQGYAGSATLGVAAGMVNYRAIVTRFQVLRSVKQPRPLGRSVQEV
jgi:hypothetical protein